jgi:predicted transcriptional regulator with HTH domain
MINGECIRAFRTSILRLKVLKFLNAIYPEKAYLSEISKALSIQETNVIGCLRGLNNKNYSYPRYDENLSLMGLGLVETIVRGNKVYYKIKDKARADEIVLMFPVRKIVEVEI